MQSITNHGLRVTINEGQSNGAMPANHFQWYHNLRIPVVDGAMVLSLNVTMRVPYDLMKTAVDYLCYSI